MTDIEFLNSFLTRVLPRPEWTHRAHLRFAWLILQDLEFDEACRFARSKIDSYNQKVGFNIGYHETITRAYLRLTHARIKKYPATDFLEFESTQSDLFEPNLKSLFDYYSKERLWSPEAKNEFVDPDLQPLP